MALPTIKKSNLLLKYTHFFSFTSQSHLHRPIYRHSSSSLHPEDHTIISKTLISIFTKHPLSSDNPELKTLAPRLTTQIVESVLKGLKGWETAFSFFTWASNQFEYGYKHNCYTYNAVASILSGARQNAQLKILAADIVSSRCSMSPGALGFFIRCLGSVGLHEDANALFDQVRMMGLCVPNSYSYNCLLEVLSKSNSVDMVEMRLNEMQEFGCEFDKYTLTPLLQMYCTSGKFDKALNVFNEVYDRGWVDAHVLSILVLAFSKWGKVDEAIELIERMEVLDVRLNEKTFYPLIHGFVKEHRVDRALQLFDKMRELGFSPHVSLFDVLISGLCRNKDLEKALCLCSEMKGFGIQPDIRIFSKLVSSFPEEVLLQEFPEDMDAKSLIVLYNSVLSGLVNDGLIDKAHNILQAMMGDSDAGKGHLIKEMVHPNTTSFSIVIGGLLKTGKLDMALSLFRDMVRVGCEQNVLLYNNLIDGLCNANRLQESYELLRKMKESGLEPTQFTHNSIFGCLCRDGDVVVALDLVKKMRIHGHVPWIKHSTSLVRKLCKLGRVVEACNFLVCMVQEGFLPDIIAYSAAIDGLIKIHKVDQALELFNDICARGYCPDVVAYNMLISGLCKANRTSEAHDLLKQMLVKGLVPSVVTYNLLIDSWCKNGDIDRAMVCLSTMFGKQREPNVITYATLIDGLCSSGRPNDALLLWNDMGQKGCVPNRIAFMALIHGLCKCGRADAALSYFHKMEEEKLEPDTYIYVVLLSSFLSQAKLPMALEILKEMVDRGKLPDPLDKNYAIVKDAIFKLSEDASTSSGIKNLIAEGRNSINKVFQRLE